MSCSNNCVTIERYRKLLLDSSSDNIPSDQIIAQMWSNGVSGTKQLLIKSSNDNTQHLHSLQSHPTHCRLLHLAGLTAVTPNTLQITASSWTHCSHTQHTADYWIYLDSLQSHPTHCRLLDLAGLTGSSFSCISRL